MSPAEIFLPPPSETAMTLRDHLEILAESPDLADKPALVYKVEGCEASIR